MISTIEGVGGEVIQFFIFLGVILICLLLWLSTRVRSPDEPFFGPVYIVQTRYERSNDETNHSQNATENSIESDHNLSNSSNSRCIVPVNRGPSDDSLRNAGDSQTACNAIASISDCENSRNFSEENPSCSSKSLSTEESAVSSDNGIGGEATTLNKIELMIKVRLKYLTDESREVEGCLNERLFEFKRRNFPEEFASGKIIRLIFNGRVLRDDNITLQNYGLFDDCVVHCLIVNEKPQQPTVPEQQDQTQQFSQNNEQASVPEWNLSKLLCFLIVGILSLTWYCRFQFATLFTFTSTSFLLGLTVIFLCSMFGTFYVDSVPLNTVG